MFFTFFFNCLFKIFRFALQKRHALQELRQKLAETALRVNDVLQKLGKY
jgi:hypothetical protein